MSRFTRYLPFVSMNQPLKALVRELPVRSLLPLGAAIFCLFAVLGPVADILGGGRLPLHIIVRDTAAAGVFAVGYAFGTLRRQWYVFHATLALQLAWLYATGPAGITLPAASHVPPQLVFDGLATMVLTMVSYACFLWFINGTAARYLRVTAEMELAHRIHQGLVPRVETTVDGFEFYGSSTPSGEVGGDLVDVVAEGNGWFGYVADVSGHGVSSGLVMGMFKSALRMRLRQGGPMAALLADLNGVLYPLKSSAMYVTLACVRDAGYGTLDYAVAGHLPILRVRGDGTVDEVTTPQIPIGMFETYAFTSASMACAPGDLFALITDGLTEVFDRADRELGLEAIKTLLGSMAGRPLADIAGAVVARARAHGSQLDDQTLLLIRR